MERLLSMQYKVSSANGTLWLMKSCQNQWIWSRHLHYMRHPFVYSSGFGTKFLTVTIWSKDEEKEIKTSGCSKAKNASSILMNMNKGYTKLPKKRFPLKNSTSCWIFSSTCCPPYTFFVWKLQKFEKLGSVLVNGRKTYLDFLEKQDEQSKMNNSAEEPVRSISD